MMLSLRGCVQSWCYLWLYYGNMPVKVQRQSELQKHFDPAKSDTNLCESGRLAPPCSRAHGIHFHLDACLFSSLSVFLFWIHTAWINLAHKTRMNWRVIQFKIQFILSASFTFIKLADKKTPKLWSHLFLWNIYFLNIFSPLFKPHVESLHCYSRGVC